jgi:hypothetical protein
MSNGTMQVFSGSAITPEELLVLAEFAAPSHFVSDDALLDAADNLAEWTDHRSSTIAAALHLAAYRDVHPTVVQLLRAAAMLSTPEGSVDTFVDEHWARAS